MPQTSLLFADDTGFLMSSPDPKKLFENSNRELEKAFMWFKHRLSIDIKSHDLSYNKKISP